MINIKNYITVKAYKLITVSMCSIYVFIFCLLYDAITYTFYNVSGDIDRLHFWKRVVLFQKYFNVQNWGRIIFFNLHLL